MSEDSSAQIIDQDNMEDNFLIALHQELSNKGSNVMEKEEDEDMDNSAISDRVITDSPGTFCEIRGLFSHGNMAASSNSKCTNSETSSLLNDHEVTEINQPLNGKQTVNMIKAQHQDSRDFQGLICESKIKEGDSVRKRKLTNQSDKSTTPEKESVDANSNLFPVFCKKDKELKESKEEDKRDQKESKKRNQAKKYKKKPKLADDSHNYEKELTELTEENLQVLDVRLAISMFKNIKEEVRDLKKDKESLEETIRDLVSRQDLKRILSQHDREEEKGISKAIESAMEEHTNNIEDIQKQLTEQKTKMHLMGELIGQKHQIILDLSKRLDSLELNNARRSIILSGLSFNSKKEDRRNELSLFFGDVFSLNPCIEDSYLLGKKQPRPVVITFDSYADKQVIMQKKRCLSEYEGEGGRGIYINDYVPTQLNEKKKRERDVIRTAKLENVSTEYTVQGLKVGEELYKKKIEAPDPCDILDLDPDKIDEVLSLDIDKGDPYRIHGNTFIPYGAAVRTHAQIRRFYMKMRLMYARARHVVCAYTIPGPKHHCQDYVDDDEHGAGRAILQLLQQSEIEHKVIFVVHFCGKPN